ncbi:MAG: hypothetical protein ACREBK_00825 [Sphingomicrobium sp.]
MMDEIFDRNYQTGRAALNADIDRSLSALSKAIGNTFRSIHRIQFAAPWNERRAIRRGH